LVGEEEEEDEAEVVTGVEEAEEEVGGEVDEVCTVIYAQNSDTQHYFTGGGVRGGGVQSRGRGGGRGAPRGRGGRGGGRGGARGGSNVVLEPHRHKGVFIAKGKEHMLVTKNLVPGESVYGEKRISVEGGDGTKIEYRVWNPFRSKLAAGILGGVESIYIEPGKKVLYLGAASGTSVSHVADVVGPVRAFALLKLLLRLIVVNRRARYTLWNSQTVLGEILLGWPKSVQMLSVCYL
jgi:hypothetical protein